MMDKENRDVLNKWLADKTGPTPCYTDEHIELLWEEILQLRYERAEAGLWEEICYKYEARESE
jgi:hypothetical protein